MYYTILGPPASSPKQRICLNPNLESCLTHKELRSCDKRLQAYNVVFIDVTVNVIDVTVRPTCGVNSSILLVIIIHMHCFIAYNSNSDVFWENWSRRLTVCLQALAGLLVINLLCIGLQRNQWRWTHLVLSSVCRARSREQSTRNARVTRGVLDRSVSGRSADTETNFVGLESAKIYDELTLNS